MMYKIETHLHTSHSSPCGKVEAETIARLYAEAGFHGIVVTDHYFHYTCRPHCWNIPYRDYFKVFIEGYHRLFKAAEPYGLKIYKGAEVRFDENFNDYLLLNYPDSLLQDPEAIFTMGLEKFSPLVRQAGALLIQAHPFRDKNTPADPALVDGYEVKNASPRAANHNELTAEFIAQHPGKLQLCGSDFHRVEDTGCGGILTEILPENEAALATLLRAENYTLLTVAAAYD